MALVLEFGTVFAGVSSHTEQNIEKIFRKFSGKTNPDKSACYDKNKQTIRKKEFV